MLWCRSGIQDSTGSLSCHLLFCARRFPRDQGVRCCTRPCSRAVPTAPLRRRRRNSPQQPRQRHVLELLDAVARSTSCTPPAGHPGHRRRIRAPVGRNVRLHRQRAPTSLTRSAHRSDVGRVPVHLRPPPTPAAVDTSRRDVSTRRVSRGPVRTVTGNVDPGRHRPRSRPGGEASRLSASFVGFGGPVQHCPDPARDVFVRCKGAMREPRAEAIICSTGRHPLRKAGSSARSCRRAGNDPGRRCSFADGPRLPGQFVGD